MIKAITFDFWDTIVKDDSDEPKRAAQGLASKIETRLQLLTAEITQYHPKITAGQVKEAFDYANERYRHHWKVEYVTPDVADRYQETYDFLKIKLTPGFGDVAQVVENMEVEISPDFVPGIQEVLAKLATDYKLGIISDTIHAPGQGLRQILNRGGLLQYFDHCVFSDEAGAAKPASTVFEQASVGLEVSLSEIVHIGDRESNDIAGALAMGMQAILYTGAIDRGSDNTQASAVCRDYAELPQIIKEL